MRHESELRSQTSSNPKLPCSNNGGNRASTRAGELSDLNIRDRHGNSSGVDLGTMLHGVAVERCTFYREGMSDTSSESCSATSSASSSQSEKLPPNITTEPCRQFSRCTSLDEFQPRSTAGESLDAATEVTESSEPAEVSWPTESSGPTESAGLAESAGQAIFPAANDFLLGAMMNAKGVGFAKKENMSAAVDHWKMAAVHYDNACACFNLGVCAEKGLVLRQDDQAAGDWYSRAATKGHLGAMYNLYLLLDCRRLNVVDPSIATPIELLRESALGGVAKAQNDYAAIRFDQNRKEAFELFRLAADQELPCAMFNAAVCYEHGWGVDSDYIFAGSLYQRAAQAGHAEAMHNFAVFLEKEFGGLSSDHLAASEHIPLIDWYRKASKLGVREATVRLQELDPEIGLQVQNSRGNLIESQGAASSEITGLGDTKPADMPTTLTEDLPEPKSSYGDVD